MRSIVFYILLIASTLANAGSQTGKISGFIPYFSSEREILIIKLENNFSGSCNTTGRFAIDSNSLSFKASQAALMAAYHAQSNIRVHYKETCNAWGNSWDILYICIGDINC